MVVYIRLCCFLSVFVDLQPFRVSVVSFVFCIFTYQKFADMRKKELKNMYPGLSYRYFIRPVINRIIANERGISLQDASMKKSVLPNELDSFKFLVGDPIQKGQKTVEHTPTKDYLIRKFSDVPIREVLFEINNVIRKNRKYPTDIPVYDKVLLPKEYTLFLANFI